MRARLWPGSFCDFCAELHFGPNQSKGFDLERKNGGADTEPPRLSAAAAWSKPVLTTPEGVFPTRMSPEKRLDFFAPSEPRTLRGRIEGVGVLDDPL